MSLSDELNKFGKAIGGLVSPGVLYAVGEAGIHSHRVTNWDAEIASYELSVHSAVGSEYKYLQIRDLIYSPSRPQFCSRLKTVYEAVLRGYDIDALMDMLYDCIRHDDDEMQESISKAIEVLEFFKYTPLHLQF